jgi:predicted DNA-binding ribbon-helix-helix protein
MMLRASRVMTRAVARDAGSTRNVSLEEDFWQALKNIAALRGLTVKDLVALIDTERRGYNATLSSAIRLFVLRHYRGL